MSIHFYGFDIETKGEKQEYALQPYRLPSGQCMITSFACVDENGLNVASGLWPSVEQLRTTLEKLAEDPWAIVVGSNTVFDVAWLIALGLEDVVRRVVWMDFQILWHALENTTEASGWGLKNAVARYMPEHAGYGDEAKATGFEVNEELLAYNIKDSLFTAQIARRMWDRIEHRQATLAQVTCQCIPAFARAWTHGVPMSRKALEVWSTHCTAEMVDALNESPFEAETIRSPQKLKAALNANGFSITSTDKRVLSLYAEHPIVKPIVRYKRAAGSVSRYINNAIKCMDYINEGLEKGIPDYCDIGTVHPAPRMWGTYTGRCTYSSKQKVPTPNKKGKVVNKQIQIGVALHQWPKKREGKIARSCIVAPQGYLLAEFDFSNQESRVLADRTQDPTMVQVFREDKDLHCMMGAQVVRKTYDEMFGWYKSGDKEADRVRQMGKVSNLSLAYRTGSETFQTMARTDYDIVLSTDESAMLVQLFKRTYPGVVQFWQEAINLARQRGYAETAGGRRVILDFWDRRSDPKRAYASEQTAINFPIQGTGADQKFLGIALTDAYAHSRGAIYMLDLHDALFYLIPDDGRALDTAREIQHILNTLPYEQVYGWKPSVPMPVDGKIGPNWGELKDINK
jgi:DNA polymerase I-like protein with 3'-5' exonuclease and polymerase domains